ncbi:outer dense fiber protein 2-like [Bacillus rossius redtenbacheri]|uniref:outer dense fiber protein 2-like n=1 Tax=Bacillus rossius redtenbacheri TaxID=93214 RepID=UPI002FDCFACD
MRRGEVTRDPPGYRYSKQARRPNLLLYQSWGLASPGRSGGGRVEVVKILLCKNIPFSPLLHAGASSPSMPLAEPWDTALGHRPDVPSRTHGGAKSNADLEVVREIETTESKIDDVQAQISDAKDFIKEKRQAQVMTEEEQAALDAKCTLLMDHMAELEAATVQLEGLVGLEAAPEEPPSHELLAASPGPATARLEDRLPRVIVTGLNDGVLPGLVVLPRPVKELGTTVSPQPQALVDRLSSELSLSYSLQEKLACDNEHLENVRCVTHVDPRSELVDTIVQKDAEVEQLEKKMHCLQRDMWIVSNENAKLNEQLANLRSRLGVSPAGEIPERDGPARSDKATQEMAAMISHHANQTAALERQLNEVTAELNVLKKELQQVQKEREQLSEMRKLLQCASPSICTPATCPAVVQGRAMGLVPAAAAAPAGEPGDDRCARLQQQLAERERELTALRVETERLKDELVRARADREQGEAALAAAQDRLRRAEAQLQEQQGARGALRETEAALCRARQELQQAHLDGQDLRSELQEQTALCAKYRGRYLANEQLIADLQQQQQAARDDLMRSTAMLNDEIQRIRADCQEKLQAMAHLPDLIGTLQRKEREADQARVLAEARCKELLRELQDVSARSDALARQLQETSSGSQLGQDHRSALQARAETLDVRCEGLSRENTSLREKVQSQQMELDKLCKAVEERDMHALQLREQLQLAQEGCARSLSRAKDNAERQRATLLEQMHDLERQLAHTRAAVCMAHKERDDMRAQMNNQVRELTDSFQQAQTRIHSLQSQVNMMKSYYDGGGLMANESGICYSEKPI